MKRRNYYIHFTEFVVAEAAVPAAAVAATVDYDSPSRVACFEAVEASTTATTDCLLSYAAARG